MNIYLKTISIIKKYKMPMFGPIIFMLVIFGVLILLSHGSKIVPFIYSAFEF